MSDNASVSCTPGHCKRQLTSTTGDPFCRCCANVANQKSTHFGAALDANMRIVYHIMLCYCKTLLLLLLILMLSPASPRFT
jgi:hypothetical protein